MHLITDVLIDPISQISFLIAGGFSCALQDGILLRGSPVVRIANASGRVKYLIISARWLIYLFVVGDASKIHQLNSLIDDHLENKIKLSIRVDLEICHWYYIIYITVKTVFLLRDVWATILNLNEKSDTFYRVNLWSLKDRVTSRCRNRGAISDSQAWPQCQSWKCPGDNESLPRSKDQCSRHAEKRCSAATAYAALQGSEDELVAEQGLEAEDIALKTPGSETEDTEDNGANAEESHSPARRFTFLRRFRSPRFGEAHHKRVPTPMKRKYRRKKSKEDIIDDEVAGAEEEPPSPDQTGMPDPYYPIYLPIDQAFKAKYVFHHKRGKTFQERLYVFLEHPGGWLCFVYHFAVWVFCTSVRAERHYFLHSAINMFSDISYERFVKTRIYIHLFTIKS